MRDHHTRKRRLRVDPQPHRDLERIKMHSIRKWQTFFDRISGFAGRACLAACRRRSGEF